MRGSALLVVLAACQGKRATVAPSDDALVRMDGWGELRFGTRIDAPPSECAMQPIGEHTPEGVAWMIVDGVVVRLDVRSPALHTEQDAKVGTSAATLRRLYPDAIEQPNKYDPEGSTWIVGPPDRAHFVFELDRTHRVVRWRAGLPPQVDWVEGCG
ncbi:MAG TPA: hypothetical protein VG755_12730 [Nannocystaceae bacterium]|nr:hypothetical protein [Nannocystaceae bacterium]